MKNEIISYFKHRWDFFESTKKIRGQDSRYQDGILDGLEIAIHKVENELKDDPEKPVIPKFVAEWIEEARTRDLNLREFLNIAPPEVTEWMFEPQEKNERIDMIVRAWIDDDYEVEEPKYYARHNWLKNRNGDNYLNEHILNLNYILENNDETKNLKTKFTESELEQLSIWDNSDWEIEEVDQEGQKNYSKI